MISKRHLVNPWLVCIPILLIFLLDVFILGKNQPLSDGIRYWKTADDILDGFMATPILDGYLLVNGPLYPLLLAFFKGIGFSVKACIYLNAFFLYYSFTFFFKTITQFVSFTKGIVATYILVFIDPFLFYWGAKLYSEPLAILWVCLLLYYSLQLFKNPKSNSIFKVAVTLTFLILTRVIFAYVTVVFLVIGLIGMIFFKQEFYKKLSKLGILSLLFCLPYLIFTYSITNKIFYWSSNGGPLLYWMASPHEEDMGEWHTLQINHDHFAARYNTFSGLDSLYLRNVNEVIINKINNNHKAFAESLKGKNILEYDDALKEKALSNIKEYPKAFFKNWILNTGRLLVGIPHAIYHKPPFSPLFTLLNTVKSSFLICFLFTCVILFLGRPIVQNLYLFWILILLIIYLGGQSLLSVQSQRFILPIYPLILFFITVVLNDFMRIKKNNF